MAALPHFADARARRLELPLGRCGQPNSARSRRKPARRQRAKARAAAQDFEAVFLNSMFQQMFTGVGEGPFSGGQAPAIWRSFLTDEYSKNFAKAGGIGIADQV